MQYASIMHAQCFESLGGELRPVQKLAIDALCTGPCF